MEIAGRHVGGSAWLRDVGTLVVCTVLSVVLWYLPWFHSAVLPVITGMWSMGLFHIARRHAMRVLSLMWLPLLIAAGLALYWFSPTIGACPSDATPSALCRSVTDHLHSSGQTRLIVRHVKFDHIDDRVTRGAQQFVERAVGGLRDHLSVYVDVRRTRRIAEKTDDLIVNGVAEAWDPDTGVDRYRGRLTLLRRTARGDTEALGQFTIGELGVADGFTIDATASTDDQDSEFVSSGEMRTSIGHTTIAGCAIFTRDCYRAEAVRRSLEPVRQGRNLLMRLVVVETEPNWFVSVASYLPCAALSCGS